MKLTVLLLSEIFTVLLDGMKLHPTLLGVKV